MPTCKRSPVCDGMEFGKGSGARQEVQRVEWAQTLGYTFTYPYVSACGLGGVPSVALDSKGDLWVFQRESLGKPQLFKFDPNHKLILTIGDDVIGHQEKAHGIAVDAEDNLWICDQNGATVKKLSPDGKLLMTIGERNHRGDWIEAKGQRLLWQPLMIVFGQNGDIYIGKGTATRAPMTRIPTIRPTKRARRASIHLDKNGKFINQWYGAKVGQGKFSMVHGLAIDPRNGDVWIGDREQYRIVIYTADGQYMRTIPGCGIWCALSNSMRRAIRGWRAGRTGSF